MMTLMERSPSPPSALAMPSPNPTLMDYEAIDVYWRRDIELEKSGLPYYVQPPVAVETDWSLDGGDTAREKGLDGLVLGMDGTDQFERDLQLLTEKQLMRPHVTTTPHPTSNANRALDEEDSSPWAHMDLGKESGLEAGQSFDDWLLPVPSPSTSALDDSTLFSRDGADGDGGDYLDDLELQSPFTSHLLRMDSCEGVEQPSTSKEESHMQKVGARKAVDAHQEDPSSRQEQGCCEEVPREEDHRRRQPLRTRAVDEPRRLRRARNDDNDTVYHPSSQRLINVH